MNKSNHAPRSTVSKKTTWSKPTTSTPKAQDLDVIQKQITEMKQMMYEMQKAVNKEVEQYNCLFSEHKTSPPQQRQMKSRTKNHKRKERRKNAHEKCRLTQRRANEKYIKNLSTQNLSDAQVSLLSKGLKFIPTPAVREDKIRRQLLRDFDQFARRMRLRYIFRGSEKRKHPFHVKSSWQPPVQPSVTLESYLEEVKTQLAEVNIEKPKQNLTHAEKKALDELRSNDSIVLKKADKGTTTVIMDKEDKVQEGQILLDDAQSYKTLENTMVESTLDKTKRLISELHHAKYIDEMTHKWLSQTQNPPRVPQFYTLTKIHKATLVGRPIISGCGGPTERLSAFVDSLLQPIAKKQESYLKDTTDFINFIERTKVREQTKIVSMDVTSLYTNIPQEEGMNTVCDAYDKFHHNNPPIPSRYLREMLRLILRENSFQFIGKNYLQTHGTAMGTKMAVAFANIFMAAIETQILSQSAIKPLVWKRYIDDIFSLWDHTEQEVTEFISGANNVHPTIKFTAEISQNNATFLDTTIYKGDRFAKESILDVRTHFKPTETFQYTHYRSCHPPGVVKGFIKGETLRLLRTNSSKATFEENVARFKLNLKSRGYPGDIVKKTISSVLFKDRQSALQPKQKANKQILPFVTQYNPSLLKLKKILMQHWHLIQNQPLLKGIFTEPPTISYKRGKSLKDTLVRAKLT